MYFNVDPKINTVKFLRYFDPEAFSRTMQSLSFVLARPCPLYRGNRAQRNLLGTHGLGRVL